jgi:hypothetical protein
MWGPSMLGQGKSSHTLVLTMKTIFISKILTSNLI